MNTPLDHLFVPSMENLYLLLDKHGDQLREMQLAVDAASTTPPEFKKHSMVNTFDGLIRPLHV